MSKGENVISRLESIEEQKQKKGLMVGQVQSGKTINFLSVILNSIIRERRMIFVLSSIVTELHDQTIERIEEAFDIKQNSSYLKIYNLNDKDKIKKFKNILKTREFQNKINENCEKGLVQIFILLKHPKIIDVIREFFDISFLVKKKTLIVDDEGDLASMSKDSKNNNLKTLNSLSRFYNIFEDCLYLSVTATPQVHLMASNNHPLLPKKVFCVEPGKGYTGLEIFEKKKFYKLIESKSDEEILDTFLNESIFYYFVAWACMMKENNITSIQGQFSNSLIHYDVKKITHENLKKKIDQIIQNLKYDLSDKEDYKYEEVFSNVERVLLEHNLQNFSNDKVFRELFIKSVNLCNTLIINSDSSDNINQSLTDIVIGSKKLERGITLKNLITTFFVNVPEKSVTAIDTLLQRARWFGYRNKILDYIKIFTTSKVKNYFEEIRKINDVTWNQLLIADKEDMWFDEIDRDIFIREDSKLKPTSKVPTMKIGWKRNYSNLFISYLEKHAYKFEFLFKKLISSNEILEIQGKYKYRSLSFDNIDIFLDNFPELENFIFNTYNNDENANSYKNYLMLKNDYPNNLKTNFKVVLLDNIDDRDAPRFRSCDKINNNWKIKNIYQGYNKKGSYVGDANWNDIPEFKNTIFLQIHYIKPIDDNNHQLTLKPIFAWSLLVPDGIASRFKSYSKVND